MDAAATDDKGVLSWHLVEMLVYSGGLKKFALLFLVEPRKNALPEK